MRGPRRQEIFTPLLPRPRIRMRRSVSSSALWSSLRPCFTCERTPCALLSEPGCVTPVPGTRHPGRHGPARFGLAAKQTRGGTAVAIQTNPRPASVLQPAVTALRMGLTRGVPAGDGVRSKSIPTHPRPRPRVISRLRNSSPHPSGTHAEATLITCTYILPTGQGASSNYRANRAQEHDTHRPALSAGTGPVPVRTRPASG